jgi:hypothetical protein
MDRVSNDDISMLIDRAERYMMREWTDEPDEACRAAELTTRALIELQERRAASRAAACGVVRLRKRPRWLRDLLDGWERSAFMLQANGEASTAETMRAMAGALRLVHNSRERRPRKWARRVKRLRDEVRTLFGAVSDLTMRVYDVEQQVYDMRREARGD